jgi:dTMP kinase
MSNKGRYIVIEGHDGTGKTTQRELLIKHLQEYGIHAVAVREPGETPIGNKLRDIIKDGTLERQALTNLLLFTADRNETWHQVIQPALAAGTWVISDRNWYSTWVYQGSEGLNHTEIERLSHDLLGKYCTPDLAFVMCADTTSRANRLQKRGVEATDTFEMKDQDFQEKVHQGYYDLGKKLNVPIIETSERTPEDIHNELWVKIKEYVDVYETIS